MWLVLTMDRIIYRTVRQYPQVSVALQQHWVSPGIGGQEPMETYHQALAVFYVLLKEGIEQLLKAALVLGFT